MNSEKQDVPSDVITIYRVENTLGRGMYHGSTCFDGIDIPQHPGPYEDSSICGWWDSNLGTRRTSVEDGEKPRLIFGFVDIKQLKVWVYRDKFKRILTKEGFTINKYELTNLEANPETDYILGDTQAIFDRYYFTHTETLQLTEI